MQLHINLFEISKTFIFNILTTEEKDIFDQQNRDKFWAKEQKPSRHVSNAIISCYGVCDVKATVSCKIVVKSYVIVKKIFWLCRWFL